MDPTDLAAAAVATVIPYLAQFGADAAKGVASSAGKSVWDWITGKLTNPAGREAVADLAREPAAPENAQALQAALIKALKSDPDALAALAKLLGEHGVAASTQTANVVGDRNQIGQASGGSTVSLHVTGSGNIITRDGKIAGVEPTEPWPEAGRRRK